MYFTSDWINFAVCFVKYYWHEWEYRECDKDFLLLHFSAGTVELIIELTACWWVKVFRMTTIYRCIRMENTSATIDFFSMMPSGRVISSCNISIQVWNTILTYRINLHIFWFQPQPSLFFPNHFHHCHLVWLVQLIFIIKCLNLNNFHWSDVNMYLAKTYAPKRIRWW